jgi:hypothetical protein
MTSLSPNARDNQRATGLTESIAISLAVASVIHFLVLFRGFYSATLDESGRTLDAYNWIRGSGSLTTVWLPFYKLIVGGTLFIAPDLFVTPRVVSYLFGMAALCSLIWLSHVLFKNRTTTLVTGLIGAVLPPRVVLSVAPLAEIMFVAAITLAIAFLVRWFSAERRRDVMLSATLFAIASSIRYEGWVFVVLFAALVIFLRLSPVNGKRLSFITARDPILVAVSFMALWITLHLIQHGRPFGFVADTVGRYALIHGDSSVSLLLNNPLTQFTLQNVWTLNILGLLSLRLFTRQSVQNRILVALPVLALLIVSTIAFLGKGMPTHGFWRIPSVWSILLVPFTAQWFVVRLGSFDPSAKLKSVPLVCLLVAVIALCVNGIYSMTEHSAFSRDDLAAGRYVHAHLPEETSGNSHKVLIESGIWSYVNVMIASQHPERFVLNTGFDPVAHGEPLLNPDEPFDEAMLQRMDVGLLVFRREDYKDYLDARTEIRRLSDYGPWTIYAFVPSQSVLSFDKK